MCARMTVGYGGQGGEGPLAGPGDAKPDLPPPPHTHGASFQPHVDAQASGSLTSLLGAFDHFAELEGQDVGTQAGEEVVDVGIQVQASTAEFGKVVGNGGDGSMKRPPLGLSILDIVREVTGATASTPLYIFAEIGLLDYA